MPARRWILCLDGTWNGTYVRKKRDDGHEVLEPSNVVEPGRSVREVDDAGRQQTNVLGGAFGAGFEATIEEALTFLHSRRRRP